MGSYVFFPYIVVLSVSFILLIGISLFGLGFRKNPGVKEFILAMLLSAWWVFCQAFELMATDLDTKLFWANVEYIGAGLSSYAFLLVVIKFTNREKYMSKKIHWFIISILSILLICFFLDSKYEIMRCNISLDTSEIPYVITKDYKVMFYVYVACTYSLIATTMFLLVKTIMDNERIYKNQAIALLTALISVSFLDFAHVTEFMGGSRFDYAPAVFSFVCIVLFLGIHKYNLFYIVPISRSILFDMLEEGFVVVDKNRTIVDCNTVFENMFWYRCYPIIGSSIYDIDFFSNNSINTSRFSDIYYDYRSGDNLFKLRVKKQPLLKGHIKIGSIYIIEDATKLYNNNKQLLSQEKTISIMREREKIGRDLHDSFGQVFGYVNIQAQTIKEYQNQGNYPKVEEKLNELIAISKDKHRDVREYILSMRGEKSKNLNFRVVLKQYIKSIVDSYNLNISIIFDEDLPKEFPSEDIAYDIIKIIQESVNNIIKHAGNCNTVIEFKNFDNCIKIYINDDGVGFNQNIKVDDESFGLIIMQERASVVGGELTINSAEGYGTRVQLMIKKEVVKDENINC